MAPRARRQLAASVLGALVCALTLACRSPGAFCRPLAPRRRSSVTLRVRWKSTSGDAPAAVKELVSDEFIRNLRDGGPHALQADALPPVDINWKGATAEDTARNVVNALCRFLYGDSVWVDQIFAGPAAARGREYLVTLSLTDWRIFGSCHSQQVRDFDRDTKVLLEELKRMDGWDQAIYRLSVQTPGTDRELRVPDELWKCELFPCRVSWQTDSKRDTKYVNRLADEHNTWRLADTHENYVTQARLTRNQINARFTIEASDIFKASVQVNSRSLKKLKVLKTAMRPEGQAEAGQGEDAPSPQHKEKDGDALDTPSEEGRVGKRDVWSSTGEDNAAWEEQIRRKQLQAQERAKKEKQKAELRQKYGRFAALRAVLEDSAGQSKSHNTEKIRNELLAAGYQQPRASSKQLLATASS